MDVQVQSHQVIDGVTLTLDGSDFQNEDTLKQAHRTIDGVFKEMSHIQLQKKDAPSQQVTSNGHKFRMVIINLSAQQLKDLEELAERNGYAYNKSFM